jgi:hypothetical protein
VENPDGFKFAPGANLRCINPFSGFTGFVAHGRQYPRKKLIGQLNFEPSTYKLKFAFNANSNQTIYCREAEEYIC